MDADEHLLYRQVNPAWIQNGQISSQTFRPTPKDAGLLSTYDSALISAASAYEHYVGSNLASAGVMAVSVHEVTVCGLTWRPDPEPFPSHAVIDFTELNNSRIRAISSKLAEFARIRTWEYQP